MFPVVRQRLGRLRRGADGDAPDRLFGPIDDPDNVANWRRGWACRRTFSAL